jgi:hypothetical protein
VRSGKRVGGYAGQGFLFEDCLPERLVALGLKDVERVVTHANQAVMLTLSRRVLRIHRGYAFAPDEVLQAVIRFLDPRVPRRLRRAAEREFLEFPVQTYAPSTPRSRRQERARPGDLRLIHRLRALHRELNERHFDGQLPEIPIRLSTRMKRRLGELAIDRSTGKAAEITLSRRHIARHPWAEVGHTMLHEMVHQWQAENGVRVDHGPGFRSKAREVGVLPRSQRKLAGDGTCQPVDLLPRMM